MNYFSLKFYIALNVKVIKRKNKKLQEGSSKLKMDTKLRLLTQPLSTNLNSNETKKYLEEMRTNGGYDILKANISRKSFTKDYTQDEIKIIKDNLENLRSYTFSDSDNSRDISIEDLQPRAVVLNEDCMLEITNVAPDESSDSEIELFEQFPSSSASGKFSIFFNVHIYVNQCLLSRITANIS